LEGQIEQANAER